jgi:hypothetical protein
VESRIRDLHQQTERLFSDRLPLLSLWQSIADNFYPERAEFTASRSLGDDFAAHLSTSYPILARRDLGNAFSSMLRPAGQQWFNMGLEMEDREDNAAKRWLEWATGVQFRAMHDRSSGFVRATKEGDQDFAAFGQCVLSAELNRRGDGLLFRNWHLRDVTWCENADGVIDTVRRRWEPTARDLNALFRGNVSEQTKRCLDKEPYKKIPCIHAVIPSEEYEAPAGKKRPRQPFVSIYYEADTGHVLEEKPLWQLGYIIPRWQTVSGSQYAYSPATVAALPDARLIQAMTLTLLEAGEKAVNPPMLAVQEAIRSDVAIFAGGITWVDAEYDERLGEVLRPLTQDKSGIPLGIDMQRDARDMIAQAFFLNKLNLPIMAGDMTATEVSQRVQEYIRNALPLFEPMEPEYNGALCEAAFDLLLRGGAFGSVQDMPQSLRGQDVRFRFESPLREASGKQKAQTFLQAKGLLAEAVALDPSARYLIDTKTALRDALDGAGVPAKWIPDEETVLSMEQQEKQMQEAQALLQTMQAGAETARTVGEAGMALQGVG